MDGVRVSMSRALDESACTNPDQMPTSDQCSHPMAVVTAVGQVTGECDAVVSSQPETQELVDKGLRVHPAVSAADVIVHRGVLVVNPALAVVQTASYDGLRAGLIAGDAALARGLVTAVSLAGALASSGLAGDAARTVEMADGRSESPGESWSRLVFAGLGMPTSELQVEICDERGRLLGRVDFLFRAQRTIVEFDGKLKYGGADGRDALLKEKRREDSLRSLGYQVVRPTWHDLHDLHDPRQLRQVMLAAFARSVPVVRAGGT